MINTIAETAWHHEGDFIFMKNLVHNICSIDKVKTVKLHLTLDLDEYMQENHPAYDTLKSWMLSESNWLEIVGIIRKSKKDLLLLLNDVRSIEFAAKLKPEMIELHSVCLNVPRMQDAVMEKFSNKTKIVVGVGGSAIEEIDQAVRRFNGRRLVLMFGFQNYPTNFSDINLGKIKKIQKLYPDAQFGYADHTSWDEKYNELITLLVASNDMEYIEKHVTTHVGKERCDYSAAISIEQMRELTKRLELVEKIRGSGSLSLNQSERKYADFGPMKMAAVAKSSMGKGEIFQLSDLHFCRTRASTSMSQVDILDSEGRELCRDVERGELIDWELFKGKK